MNSASCRDRKVKIREEEGSLSCIRANKEECRSQWVDPGRKKSCETRAYMKTWENTQNERK